MSSTGPAIDPDALRKNVSGTFFGSPPVSFTCEAKLVIWATTRHGSVTGDSSSRLLTGTVSVLAAARSIGGRSANSCAVVVASVSTLAAASGVPAHQPSSVR